MPGRPPIPATLKFLYLQTWGKVKGKSDLQTCDKMFVTTMIEFVFQKFLLMNLVA